MFQEKDILHSKGSISNAEMEKLVHQQYDQFNERRKHYEAEIADAEDIKELEELEKSLQKRDSRG